MSEKRGVRSLVLGAVLAAGLALPAQAQVKLAFIDPLSGPGGGIGDLALKHFQFMAEEMNARGTQKYEVTGYDSKGNPQEALIQAQKAIDGGARIISQGAGSAVTAALIDYLNKHNQRNPDRRAILLNWSGADDVFVNDKCSYWHFRFEAGNAIKLQVATDEIKNRPQTRKVYLINQDYSSGQAVRATARDMLAKKRPDIEIVGDEVHPLMKITDFSPYIAKIRASGADAVITSDWGQDMALLLKAAGEAKLDVDWYAFYAGGPGGATLMKQADLPHRVFTVLEGYGNVDSPELRGLERKFRAKYKQGFTFPKIATEMQMLDKAISTGGSADAAKVAEKLEDMKVAVVSGGGGFMRKRDHQLFEPLYVASFGPLGANEPFDEEGTGWGWHTIRRVSADDTVVPSTCTMTNRPN